jgi:NAD(P)-dependent dehydrogenase (short-subunit alcohol dehydrogenase family)
VARPFADQSCLVTGAGSGIGAATVALLVQRGAPIAAVGLPTDPPDETIPAIAKVAAPPSRSRADMTVAEDMRRAVANDYVIQPMSGSEAATQAVPRTLMPPSTTIACPVM